MTIKLPADLQIAVAQAATRLGVTPQDVVEQVIRERLTPHKPTSPTTSPSLQPIDDWERKLLAIARPCGVSLSDEALNREQLYD